MAKFLDLVGQVFSDLVVIAKVGKDNRGHILWNCLCCCGTNFQTTTGELKRGRSNNCGCKTEQRRRNSIIKHGLAYSGEYNSWRAMKQRCLNPKAPNYENYGGRGIKLCQAWLKFENFYRDMGERPEGYSIDRINNDGDYEPGNCRWATQEQQYLNQRKWWE